MTDNAVAARPSLATWWTLVKTAITSWLDDYAPSMGAALSYYTLFSLAPLLLIVIAVAGLVFGDDAARGEIVRPAAGLMGERRRAWPSRGCLTASNKPGKSVAGDDRRRRPAAGRRDHRLRRTAGARSTASGARRRRRRRPASGAAAHPLAVVRPDPRPRLPADRVAGAERGAGGARHAGGRRCFGGWETCCRSINSSCRFGVVDGRVRGDLQVHAASATIAWRDVWVGALVTAVLFTIGKFLIGLYIGKSGVASGFGAAGSLVVLLVWVYYSAQIFLLGAEFTWVYAKTLGSLRGVEGVAEVAQKAATAEEAPTRSADPPGSDAAAAAAEASASAPRPERAAARPRSFVGDVGTGVAFVLALRFIVPRLLRRLMKIATFNINNVNRRLPNLLELAGARPQPDVVCLQELKADRRRVSARRDRGRRLRRGLVRPAHLERRRDPGARRRADRRRAARCPATPPTPRPLHRGGGRRRARSPASTCRTAIRSPGRSSTTSWPGSSA